MNWFRCRYNRQKVFFFCSCQNIPSNWWYQSDIPYGGGGLWVAEWFGVLAREVMRWSLVRGPLMQIKQLFLWNITIHISVANWAIKICLGIVVMLHPGVLQWLLAAPHLFLDMIIGTLVDYLLHLPWFIIYFYSWFSARNAILWSKIP